MSGFTIPNTPDALDQNQAEPDSLDFQILGKQVNGVVSGMTVTPGTGQAVNVALGEVLIGGAYYPYTASSVSLTPYASSNFFDIIVARLTGSTITCHAIPGTTGTNPRFPTTVNHTTEVVLASVWRVNSSAPVSSAITDKRVFVRSNTNRVGATATTEVGNHADLWVQPTSWTPSATLESPLSVKVNNTWYKLARYDATGNFTAGTVNATTFVGNLTGNVNGTLDGYDTSVLENGSTIVVRDTDASIRASYFVASGSTSVFTTMLATSLTASTLTAQGVSNGYQFRALWGGSISIPDFSWQGKENYGMFLGQNLEAGVYQIGFTINGTLRYKINASGGVQTSSLRYKEDVREANFDIKELLNVELVTYKPKGAEGRVTGVIAEQLDEIESCRQFVSYDSAGQPDGVAYDRLAVAYIELLKDHESRLQALENGAN